MTIDWSLRFARESRANRNFQSLVISSQNFFNSSVPKNSTVRLNFSPRSRTNPFGEPLALKNICLTELSREGGGYSPPFGGASVFYVTLVKNSYLDQVKGIAKRWSYTL